MNSTHSYIVDGCRTPIGRFLGMLADVPAPELAAIAIREALARSHVRGMEVQQAILGNVLSAGVGQAPARQAALKAGIPPTVDALTVNKVCGSGLKAVMLADQAIRAGDASCIVAGGMESMSRAPHLVSGLRTGIKLGNQPLVDSMLYDGLWCACEDVSMGALADRTAVGCSVNRVDQDALAIESHRRAVAAREGGKFKQEIVAVSVPSRGGPKIVDQDEGPRADSGAEQLARLKPSFGNEGTVTAGNASQISDGAAAVLVVDADRFEKFRTPRSVRIVATATAGRRPEHLFTAPIDAIGKVLEKARLRMTDIDLVEINEAFAAQTIACLRGLGLDSDRVNVHGGAIALGHPIGASGARVLVTLLHALADRGLKRGLASLCLGGGEAVAMVVERVG